MFTAEISPYQKIAFTHPKREDDVTMVIFKSNLAEMDHLLR